MEIIKRKKSTDAHPYIPELKDLYRKGRISRRVFLRNATLLGMSAAAASAFVTACAPTPTPAPATATPAPVAPTATAVPAVEPTPQPVPGVVHRGGVLRLAGPVHRIVHPAQYSWIMPSNQTRTFLEYLAVTDGNNVTHPWLMEKWEATEDLSTWTLYLRKNVTWSNGDPFVADDVVFTLNQWLDPDVGSSILGLMAYLSPGGIEKVDDHTVKLHLDTAEIAIPEHMYHYPAQVLHHKTFEGDIIRAPVGTGPFVLEDYVAGETFRVKRRDDYWGMGEDGNPLPYLDGMVWNDMGEEMPPHISALQAGEVDMIDISDQSPVEAFLALRDDPNIQIAPSTTAVTRVLRMRADIDPFTDNRVRMAIKLCQNREKILQLAYFGEGVLGQDVHVAPVHPEYCQQEIPAYDPERAKALLAEAGYPDGLDVDLAVATGWSEVVKYAEILQEDAAAAGLRINLNTMPTAQYWDLWTEVPFGITPWTHRPLGTMVLNLAYIADERGEPVPWNETRWVDDEFTGLLRKANGTLDVEERRKMMCQLQDIQWERGSIGIAFWMNYWMFGRKNVKNLRGHPTSYIFPADMWLDPS